MLAPYYIKAFGYKRRLRYRSAYVFARPHHTRF